jgi:hypothetical protein
MSGIFEWVFVDVYDTLLCWSVMMVYLGYLGCICYWDRF